MRFLADENLPRATIEMLRADGHEVDAVADFAPGLRDADVLVYVRNHRQVLLSFDADFGELLYRRGATAPEGVVYLRFIPSSPAEPAEILRSLLALQGFELRGRFTVVTRDRVRQRPLLRPA